MRQFRCLAIVSAWMAFSSGAWAAQPEKVQGPDGCPTITHVPVVTVVRGKPAVIPAKVECAGGELSSVKLFVRLTDAGKPSSMDMDQKGDDLYEATVPVSMVEGIHRFWYYIDAQGKATPDQEKPGVAQTRWHPVNIIEYADTGGGAGGNKAAYWLLGGLGAAGAYLVYDHNQDDGGGGNGNNNQPPAGPPANGGGGGGGGGGDNGNGDDDDGTDTCIATGAESASAAPSSACNEDPISIFVCNTCPNATIEAVGDWGASDSQSGYNGANCSSTGPAALTLPRPEDAEYGIGDFSISVFANGQLIGVISWPDESFFDCFDQF